MQQAFFFVFYSITEQDSNNTENWLTNTLQQTNETNSVVKKLT